MSGAKDRVVANSVRDLWVVSLLTEFDVKMSNILIIWCDNTGIVVLTENLIQHSKMKHVELDLCFVTEKVENRQVIVNFVPPPDQVADILTKPLTEKVFVHFRKKLGVMSFTDIQSCYEFNTGGLPYSSSSSTCSDFDSD